MKNREFLQLLYGKLKTGALSVSYFKNKRLFTKWFSHDELDKMSDFIGKVGQSCDTYINVNPRAKPLPNGGRGEKKDISVIVGYYHDYDLKDSAHSEKRLPETADELLAFIWELPRKPSAIILSGHGIHCYYLFNKPVVLTPRSRR